MTQHLWFNLSALALAGSLFAAPAMANTPVEALRRQLKTSVCLNDWPTAIDDASALMASPAISADDRAELVAFRHQLQTYQQRNLRIDAIPGCSDHFSQFMTTVPNPDPPLRWDRALYSVLGIGEPDLTPDPVLQQITASQRAGLDTVIPTAISALGPARWVNTTLGSGISAGAVSQGVEVFALAGGQGDRITVELNVTRILPGLLFADDDSQLYLFDSQGYLLAANDDFAGLQSRLADIRLPSAGLYYVAVTTYNNAPFLSGDRQLLGWRDQGSSAIEYTLTVTGLTPSGQLALPTLAPSQE